jgi:hypothetical protein
MENGDGGHRKLDVHVVSVLKDTLAPVKASYHKMHCSNRIINTYRGVDTHQLVAMTVDLGPPSDG